MLAHVQAPAIRAPSVRMCSARPHWTAVVRCGQLATSLC